MAAMGVAAALLCGCANTYVIVLKDGTRFHTKDRPVLDGKTGYYKYRDRFGKDSLVKQDEVFMLMREE